MLHRSNLPDLPREEGRDDCWELLGKKSRRRWGVMSCVATKLPLSNSTLFECHSRRLLGSDTPSPSLNTRCTAKRQPWLRGIHISKCAVQMKSHTPSDAIVNMAVHLCRGVKSRCTLASNHDSPIHFEREGKWWQKDSVGWVGAERRWWGAMEAWRDIPPAGTVARSSGPSV